MEIGPSKLDRLGVAKAEGDPWLAIHDYSSVEKKELVREVTVLEKVYENKLVEAHVFEIVHWPNVLEYLCHQFEESMFSVLGFCNACHGGQASPTA